MGQLAILGGKMARKLPFPKWPVYGEEEEAALLEVLHSNNWGRLSGTQVDRFISRFAAYHGAEHGVAISSGSAALRIALLALGLEPGDEVIVPPYTFLATATAVIEANGTPVFADIQADTFNLNPDSVQAAITSRTRAIIPVHLGGLPVDFDALRAIAEEHGLYIIEDACHAHGARYKDRSVGSLGDMACFSFQSTKNMTSGEGGIILTNNTEMYQRCASIHNCGRVPGGAWYEHHTISGNYRMTEFQGAVLNCQLDRLEEQANRRDINGRLLAELLEPIPGITPQQRSTEHTRHGYHLFVFRYDAQIYGVPRARYLEALTAEGIPVCGGYAIPLYRQPIFLNKAFGPYTGYKSVRTDLDYSHTSCPVCERICAEEGAWFDQHVLLGSDEDMDEVAQAFEKIYACRNELA